MRTILVCRGTFASRRVHYTAFVKNNFKSFVEVILILISCHVNNKLFFDFQFIMRVSSRTSSSVRNKKQDQKCYVLKEIKNLEKYCM